VTSEHVSCVAHLFVIDAIVQPVGECIAALMAPELRPSCAKRRLPSIEAKIATLDKVFLTKAVDYSRLSASYGPDGFWRSAAQFESSLSDSERETWAVSAAASMRMSKRR